MASVKWSTIALLMLFLVLPSALAAERIMVEAENFMNFHDIGLTPIFADDNLLRGLDFAGEWTEYQVPGIYDLGTRSILIKVWGTEFVQYHLQVTVAPEHMATSQTIDVVFTGMGSCGA